MIRFDPIDNEIELEQLLYLATIASHCERGIRVLFTLQEGSYYASIVSIDESLSETPTNRIMNLNYILTDRLRDLINRMSTYIQSPNLNNLMQLGTSLSLCYKTYAVEKKCEYNARFALPTEIINQNVMMTHLLYAICLNNNVIEPVATMKQGNETFVYSPLIFPPGYLERVAKETAISAFTIGMRFTAFCYLLSSSDTSNSPLMFDIEKAIDYPVFHDKIAYIDKRKPSRLYFKTIPLEFFDWYYSKPQIRVVEDQSSATPFQDRDELKKADVTVDNTSRRRVECTRKD